MLRLEVEKEKEGRKVVEEEARRGKEELTRQEKEQNKRLEDALQEREREKQVENLKPFHISSPCPILGGNIGMGLQVLRSGNPAGTCSRSKGGGGTHLDFE